MRWRLWTVWLALIGPAIPVSAHAAAAQPADNAAFAADFAKLQQQDAYIQRIGWRLLTGNAAFCDETRLASGMLVQDAGAYGHPAAIRQLLSLRGDAFVQAVIPGSGADQAGMEAGAEVHAVDRTPLSGIALPPDTPWQRLTTFNAVIARSLADDGTARFQVTQRGAQHMLTVAGTAICDSFFEVISGSDTASANGTRIAIGRQFVGFAYAQEELAAALAHELAHNVLAHPDWLDKNGRKRSNIRQTEREADRLMPWLLHNAGYDSAASVRFMERWGPQHDGGFFRRRTHDAWEKRRAMIAAELPRIAASLNHQGQADWRGNFIPQFTR
ncbi:hypothetical protein [Pontixanthobacter sp.]|uniref:hypothetical protein n=1 Tax=Pontixanthobacter sp. TaxID=2792078 RepID=UPI003C799A48